MKKTSIIVLVIASVMLLASCGGVNEFNTPKDVIGEWKGSTSEAVDTSTVDANDYAGTYTFEAIITNPEYKDTVTDYVSAWDGTSREYMAPVTNTINVKRTIKDDYSFTEKLTIVTSVAQRNSIDAESTSTYRTNGSPTYLASSKTIVRDIEVVVTPNKDGSFLEKTTTTDTIFASGAYGIFDNMSYGWSSCDYLNKPLSTTAQTRTTVRTSYVKDVNELAYSAGKTVYYFDIDQNYNLNGTWSREVTLDSLWLNLSNFTKTDAPTVTTTYTAQTDYNLVVDEDGTFTYTTTETKKYTAPEAKDVVVKNVYTGMATGSGDGYLTLNTKKAVYTVDAGEAVTEAFSKYDTYDYYIVNKTLQINGMPTLTLVEPAK